MRKLFMIGAISTALFSNPLHATEFEFGISPVWWQYEESSEQRAGIVSTLFQSQADGFALAAEAVAQYDLNQRWLIEGSWKGLLSIGAITEKWHFNGGRSQSNQLAIRQSEFQAALIHRLNALQVGAWSSYQWHEQSRKRFVSNGVPILLPVEPVKERVQTMWAGITLRYDLNDWLMAIDAGLPVWVDASNDMIAGSFQGRSGYRVDLRIKRALPWQVGNAETAVIAAYHYRQLGNDLKPATLWPKNTWTAVSIGMVLAW